MAEWIPFKQKFLMNQLSIDGDDSTCLFADATKVFNEERKCLRHESGCVPRLVLH